MELAAWISEWTSVATYTSAQIPDVDEQIARVLKLCSLPVSSSWPRPEPEDDKWKAAPYRRGDRGAPSTPERTIEHEILGDGPTIAEGRECCGGRTVDGINAIALTRTPKVEADLLLLVDHDGDLRLYLAEVKAMANNPWYATVELLRQMRLLVASSHATDYFQRRNPAVPSSLPLTGLVLAPREYYTAAGQRANAVGPARRLIEALRSQTALDVRLATWDGESATIAELD